MSIPKRKRPRVILNCPADVHHAQGERVVEFSFPDGSGGLISLRTQADGKNVVELYRVDGPTVVRTSSGDKNL